jgi:hypothetical protein
MQECLLHFVVSLSAVLRGFLRTSPEGLVSPSVYGLLAVYLVCSVVQPTVSWRWTPWTHFHPAAPNILFILADSDKVVHRG